MDDDLLTPLHPDYVKVLRIGWALRALLALTVTIAIESTLTGSVLPLPTGIVSGPVLLLALLLVIRAPQRRFRAAGYSLDGEWLRVVTGVWRRSDTVVPFVRVQHIDVDQGAIERFYGLGTLVLHTAGSMNTAVKLPGLTYADALAIRDTVRARIGREQV